MIVSVRSSSVRISSIPFSKICEYADCFAEEHEISGDVLLELDANVLKSELEIHAFGKRTRIIKEIDALRRPPSIVSTGTNNGLQQSHQRTISQSVSLPRSAHHSLQSPLALGGALSPESPPHTGDLVGTPAFANFRRDSDPGSFIRVGENDHDASTAGSSALGLGITQVPGVGSNEDLQGGRVSLILEILPGNVLISSKEEPTRLFELVSEQQLLKGKINEALESYRRGARSHE